MKSQRVFVETEMDTEISLTEAIAIIKNLATRIAGVDEDRPSLPSDYPRADIEAAIKRIERD